MTGDTLFPTDLPERDVKEFRAAGFEGPVPGVVYRGSNPPICGMPLGGLATGCLDLEATGLLGYCTIFNSLLPRPAPLEPLLGISIDRQTWVLTTLNMAWRDERDCGQQSPRRVEFTDVDGDQSAYSLNGVTWGNQLRKAYYHGVRRASEIHYWGHYPVVDIEFVTDSPVGVGLRAWSPFIPGDASASGTPGTVFEVHLRNRTDRPQKGTLAFSFPGPTEAEAGTTHFSRRPVDSRLKGVNVTSDQASYVLGVIDGPVPRIGGSLGTDGTAWQTIDDDLPFAASQAGASLGLDFDLAPRQVKAIRIVLAWHAPQWRSSGRMDAEGERYVHRYAGRYNSALETARYLAENHAALLERVLSWQAAIYSDASLPAWLRDALVNSLHLITETAVWAQASPPIGDWCRPEDGLFCMNESPRWCPQVECIPCSFYGNLPLVYFFPGAAISQLRAYKEYMTREGRASWIFGPKPYGISQPVPDRSSDPQTALNGPSYVDMVDKMWRRTGDEEILREFYPSVRLNTEFTMNLVPGPGGVVSMPEGNSDWYEFCKLPGIVPHVGGAHLAQLRIARRMAEAVGDDGFALRCDNWLAEGTAALEDYGWAGSHYFLYNDFRAKTCSDIVLSNQLDGEWIALFHGQGGVFDTGRVSTTLNTLKRSSIRMTDCGAVTFCRATGDEIDGSDWDPGYWGSQGVHPPGTFILAMLYMYRGEGEFGLELAGRPVAEVIRRGWYWDWPVLIDGAMGARTGCDYYQNLVLWSMPAAMAGEDLAGPCKPGGLVDRVLRAGEDGGARN